MKVVKPKQKGPAGAKPTVHSHPPKTSSAFPLWQLALILTFTFILLFSCIQNGFTNWDDPTYILDNPLIKEFSASNISRIFTEVYFSNYQPLHIFSYAIEYYFFKDQAAGYHAVSIVMHLINTALICWLAWLVSSKKWVCILTSLLFGIHPLHIESIAWAAERKDLLYAMFFFLSMIFYVKYIQKTENRIYLLYAFIFFLLSIFSKTMAASLPPVLVLLDIFYKRKWNGKVIMEKIPFFLVAVIMGIISVKASAESGSIAGDEIYTFSDRLFFANFNLFFYFFKLILPINLSAYYPYPEKISGSIQWFYYVSPLFSVGLLGAVIYSFKKSRLLFMWIGFFVTTIFLVLQLLPVGPAIFSERYSYIPSAGFFILIAIFVESLIHNPPSYIKNLKTGVWIVFGIWSIWLAFLTYQRCGVWKDSISLWNNVIDQFDKALHAYNNRADAYYKNGNYELSIRDLNKAISINDSYAMAWYNRGNAYGQLGKFKEAFHDLDKAIQLDPKNANAYNKRGQANAVLGNKESAFADFNKAVAMDPSNPEIFYNIGITWLNQGNKEEACKALFKSSQMGYPLAMKAFSEICK